MAAIFDLIDSIISAIVPGLQYIVWLLTGLRNLGAVMMESLGILEDVLQFFPSVVGSTIIGMCGGLIVFRIFGRS